MMQLGNDSPLRQLERQMNTNPLPSMLVLDLLKSALNFYINIPYLKSLKYKQSKWEFVITLLQPHTTKYSYG